MERRAGISSTSMMSWRRRASRCSARGGESGIRHRIGCRDGRGDGGTESGRAVRSERADRVSGAFRVGDIRHNFADLTRASSMLGYSPRTGFAEGIEHSRGGCGARKSPKTPMTGACERWRTGALPAMSSCFTRAAPPRPGPFEEVMSLLRKAFDALAPWFAVRRDRDGRGRATYNQDGLLSKHNGTSSRIPFRGGLCERSGDWVMGT